MNLKLSRVGTFTSQFLGSSDLKCGPPSIETFQYEVVIKATDEKLSPQGFLIEHSRIQTFFDKHYPDGTRVKSCELIAMHAAKTIGSFLQNENISVRSVSVTISGSPMAKINAEWIPPIKT